MITHWLHPNLVVMRPSNGRSSEHKDQSLRIRSKGASRCRPPVVLMGAIPYTAATMVKDHPRESPPLAAYCPSPCCARHAFTASSLMSLGEHSGVYPPGLLYALRFP